MSNDVVQLDDKCMLYHAKKAEELTFGYLRRIEKEQRSRNIIPKEISALCFKYLHDATAYFGICDLSCSKIELIHSKSNKTICPYIIYQKLSGKGKLHFHKATDIIFLSVKGFDCGIHDFNFQCISSHPNDKIGIVEVIDIDKLKKANFGKICLYDNVFGYRYYWWKHTHYIWRNDQNYLSTINHKQWKANDFIKMQLNCEKWTIQFFVNGIKVTNPVNIHPKTKYYPAIALGLNSSVYNYSFDVTVKSTDNRFIRHLKYDKNNKSVFKTIKQLFSNIID